MDQFSENNSFNEENSKFVEAYTGCIKELYKLDACLKKVLRLYSNILEKNLFMKIWTISIAWNMKISSYRNRASIFHKERNITI